MDNDDRVTCQNVVSGNARSIDAKPGGGSATAYEVGYKKPPKQTRWKKGCKSPNPSGRPRRKETVQDILEEELERQVTAVEGGKRRRISLRRGLVRQLIKDALEGDNVARKIVLGSASATRNGPVSAAGGIPEDVVEFTLLLEDPDDPRRCPTCGRLNANIC